MLTVNFRFVALGKVHRVLKINAVLLGTLLLNACVSTGSLDVPTQPPAAIEDRTVVDGKALPLPESPTLSAETIDEPERTSPVVARLIASAQSQRAAGRWDAASSSLERALRIEPRNANLWSRLAEVKFDQKDWKNTIQLASRSNTLSGNNAQLRRRNWYMMAQAYESLGNPEAAARFREKNTIKLLKTVKKVSK